jgi:hypothetical protein
MIWKNSQPIQTAKDVIKIIEISLLGKCASSEKAESEGGPPLIISK